MPFVKSDPAQAQEKLVTLLENPDAKLAYDEFTREYAFRMELAKSRRENNVTQKEIQQKTGLPQQSISRIESGGGQRQSPTLRTLLKYVDAIGCELTLKKKG